MENRPVREMAAVLVRRGNTMLVVHNIKHGGRRVEPPGGKVDPGETHQACAAREAREELGAEVRVTGEILPAYETQTPEGPFRVRLFVAEILSGEPRVMEPAKHDRVEWCDIARLRQYAAQGILVPNLVAGLGGIEAELSKG